MPNHTSTIFTPHTPLIGDLAPIDAGGKNFETHKWLQFSDDAIVLSGASRFYSIAWIYIAVGLFFLVLPLFALLLEPFDFMMVFMVMLAATAIWYGLTLYRSANQKTVISKQTGIARVQKWGRIKLDNLDGLVLEIPSEKISAIQDLRHAVAVRTQRGSTMRYWQYQINVVLVDGKRENIMLSVSEAKADAAARAIATLLDKPHQLVPGRRERDRYSHMA